MDCTVGATGPPTTPRNAGGVNDRALFRYRRKKYYLCLVHMGRLESSQWVATVSTRPATESSRGGSLCDFDWRCPTAYMVAAQTQMPSARLGARTAQKNGACGRRRPRVDVRGNVERKLPDGGVGLRRLRTSVLEKDRRYLLWILTCSQLLNSVYDC